MAVVEQRMFYAAITILVFPGSLLQNPTISIDEPSRNIETETEPMKNVVIAGYVRSPFHIANKGALVKVRPDDLAAQVV